MLEVGTKAPSFELPDQNGVMHSLEQYRGKKVILYFYPKDNTAGCTKQACGFSERYPQFTEKGAVVLGQSFQASQSKQFLMVIHFQQHFFQEILMLHTVWLMRHIQTLRTTTSSSLASRHQEHFLLL